MCPSLHDQSHFSERKYAQANILVPSKNEGQRTNQGRFGLLAFLRWRSGPIVEGYSEHGDMARVGIVDAA
jgi:hypothetical protein